MKWVLQILRKTVQSEQDLEDPVTDQKQGKSAKSPNPGKKGIRPF